MISMVVTQIDGKWWILDPHDPDPLGPYQNKADAEADARGLKRFYRYENVPGFITSDRGVRE